jgi:hypothetical protein
MKLKKRPAKFQEEHTVCFLSDMFLPAVCRCVNNVAGRQSAKAEQNAIDQTTGF